MTTNLTKNAKKIAKLSSKVADSTEIKILKNISLPLNNNDNHKAKP